MLIQLFCPLLFCFFSGGEVMFLVFTPLLSFEAGFDPCFFFPFVCCFLRGGLVYFPLDEALSSKAFCFDWALVSLFLALGDTGKKVAFALFFSFPSSASRPPPSRPFPPSSSSSPPALSFTSTSFLLEESADC